MDSDSSFYYETTYSEDERIKEYIQLKRKTQRQQEEKINENREKIYDAYRKDNQSNTSSIFHLQGMTILKFNHLRIKISFTPKEVVQNVSRKVCFYCSFRYRHKNWWIKRNSFPVNMKPIIYELFQEKRTIDEVIDFIYRLHEELVEWSEKEHEFRTRKFRRYKFGDSDIELDSDDEEIFLSPDEIEERKRRKEEIWMRMLPPKRTSLKKGMRRRHFRI